MSIQTIFILTLFISIVLYFFSFFEEKLSSEVPVSKPIIIEPIVIPKSVKEESNDEILEKLKLVTKEAFENAEPSEDEVAKEVLVVLKALLKSREDEKQRVLDEKIKREKQKKLLRQKEREKREKLERKRECAKKKLLKQKELARKKLAKERAYAKKKELARKKKLQEKRRLVKKRELEKKKTLSLTPQITHARVKTVKEGVLLGEQQDIYTLSKEEEKNFHNLEVVSKSKTFTLEDTPKIKSPKQYQGVQNKVKIDELPLVDTLGVINVSKPFLKHQD